MTDPIDIAEPLYDIFRRLNLEPGLVSKLELTRKTAVVTHFLVDENGEKYIEDGEPAVAIQELAIVTAKPT